MESLGYSYKLINDEGFRDLKFILSNTMKIRTASGIGIMVKQADVLSTTAGDYLWSLGFLLINNPSQLLNRVIFCIDKCFRVFPKEHKSDIFGIFVQN